MKIPQVMFGAIAGLILIAGVKETAKAQALGNNSQSAVAPTIDLTRPVSENILPKPLTLPEGVTVMPEGRVAIKGGRPLAIAAKFLSQKLGVPISFEDAMWLADADVQHVALPANYRAQFPKNLPSPPDFLVVREKAFEFRLEPAVPGAGPSAESVIGMVVEAHNRALNSAEFKMIRFGRSEYSIVAVSAGDKTGSRKQQLLPLDTRISFPEKRRTLDEAVSEICKAVTLANSKVGPPLIDMDSHSLYGANTYISIGADNEIARDVLAKVLGPRPDFPNGKLSWLVFFDPTSQQYSLTLYDDLVETTRPDGSLGLKNQAWDTKDF